MTVDAPGSRVLAAAHIAQALTLRQLLIQLQAVLCCHDQITCCRRGPEELQETGFASGTLQEYKQGVMYMTQHIHCSWIICAYALDQLACHGKDTHLHLRQCAVAT